ncbi:mitochondrial K+-H+ exchange-related-domain-containing protein [Apiospora rasikravindrae]|uniref:Mitochondrial K+-H+ exchange-related-domain-containing protein n=1 Tax=Apiospora rasikravindrae TaxID=990691 RepID=A0ABR1U2C8_9PEZI
MRLYLLPISTRRTLLYCERFNVQSAKQRTIVDNVTSRAATLWASWEKKESGWQRKIVDYGNHALRRIPYEEWGLKSVPPLSARRRDEELKGQDRVELVFPDTVIPADKAAGVLKTLGTERESLHKKNLIWCLVGMPITIPFALVPVIPNLPFFYLVYRAWSHWRALAGGKHLEFLLSNNLLALTPSPILNKIYPSILPRSSEEAKKSTQQSTSERPLLEKEVMLLSQTNEQELAKVLDVPELEVEVERAMWQVQHAIQKEEEEKVAKQQQQSASETKSKGE